MKPIFTVARCPLGSVANPIVTQAATRCVKVGCALFLTLVSGGAAAADAAYPTKPLRLLVGSSPGGPLDLVARRVGPKISEALGQTVVVDNRAGAGGTIAAESVARAAPDGYTLFLGSATTLCIAPHLYPKIGYDTLRKVLAHDDVAGAVVSHGTATLEETAYLMDLTLGAHKPVVVMGSTRNFDEKDSDAPRNLLYAAKIAADPASAGRGVLVSLGGEIHAAREAVKAHTRNINAFASRDGGILGMVTKDGVTYFNRPERRLHLEVDHVKTNVQFIVMTQGANDLLPRACLQHRVDGIVVAGVGGGHVNVPWFDALCDALQAGIPVVMSTRAVAGPTHLSKAYPGSLPSLVGRGAIPAGYLSGIKARILLMVALARTQDREELRSIFARA